MSARAFFARLFGVPPKMRRGQLTPAATVRRAAVFSPGVAAIGPAPDVASVGQAAPPEPEKVPAAVPSWDGSRSYGPGERVYWQGRIYRSIDASNNAQPDNFQSVWVAE